jgi:uncharacterized protein (TIGR02246 family)
MDADTAIPGEVLQAADRLCQAISHRDVEAAMALFVTDPDVSFFGSGGGQPHRGPDAVKGILAKIMALPETFYMHLIDPVISARGETAWLAAGADMECRGGDGSVRHHAYRLTLLLEKRGSRWLIAHYHGSEPPVS